MHGNCKCPHHWVSKILAALVWVAGVLFFWTSIRATAVWGFESLYYAWVVVVLSLMSFVCRHCGCCLSGQGGLGKMEMTGGKIESGKMMCSHEDNCKCGDCDRCH